MVAADVERSRIPQAVPYDTRALLYAGYAPMIVTHCCTSSMAYVGIERSGGGGVSVGGGAGGGGGSSW